MKQPEINKKKYNRNIYYLAPILLFCLSTLIVTSKINPIAQHLTRVEVPVAKSLKLVYDWIIK